MIRAKTAYEANAGRLSDIDRWSPTNKQRSWLLISGSTYPKESIAISDRRPRVHPKDLIAAKSGPYLNGVSVDLQKLFDKIPVPDHKKSILNLAMKKDEVVKMIRSFLVECSDNNYKPMLYYTGHGREPIPGTSLGGNWAFTDGLISIEEIFEMSQEIFEGMEYPTIICDCCYSGRWANYCAAKKIGGFECLSAAQEDEQAGDTPHGGFLTLYILGEIDSVPASTPLFGADYSYNPPRVQREGSSSSLTMKISVLDGENEIREFNYFDIGQ